MWLQLYHNVNFIISFVTKQFKGIIVMNKLLPLFICTILATPYISGMKKTDIQPVNQADELKNALTIMCINANTYIPKSKPEILSQTVCTMRLVSKEISKELSDPRVISSLISKFVFSNNFFEWRITDRLKFPGAQQCIALSDKLYDKDLTIDKVEELFNQGAILNYNQTNLPYVLSHWSLNRNPEGTSIVKKLLELGTTPDHHNSDEPMRYALFSKNKDTIMLLLKWKATKAWNRVILEKEYQEFRKLLMDHSTPEELNEGLKVCIMGSYKPEIMQEFINHGADVNVALAHANIRMQNSYYHNTDYRNHTTNIINFLHNCLSSSAKSENSIQ